MYTYTHTHIYIYTYIHTYIHTHTHLSLSLHIYISLFIYIPESCGVRAGPPPEQTRTRSIQGSSRPLYVCSDAHHSPIPVGGRGTRRVRPRRAGSLRGGAQRDGRGRGRALPERAQVLHARRRAGPLRCRRLPHHSPIPVGGTQRARPQSSRRRRRRHRARAQIRPGG